MSIINLNTVTSIKDTLQNATYVGHEIFFDRWDAFLVPHEETIEKLPLDPSDPNCTLRIDKKTLVFRKVRLKPHIDLTYLPRSKICPLLKLPCLVKHESEPFFCDKMSYILKEELEEYVLRKNLQFFVMEDQILCQLKHFKNQTLACFCEQEIEGGEEAELALFEKLHESKKFLFKCTCIIIKWLIYIFTNKEIGQEHFRFVDTDFPEVGFPEVDPFTNHFKEYLFEIFLENGDEPNPITERFNSLWSKPISCQKKNFSLLEKPDQRCYCYSCRYNIFHSKDSEEVYEYYEESNSLVPSQSVLKLLKYMKTKRWQKNQWNINEALLSHKKLDECFNNI